jgi:hypothetical protein
MPLKGLQLSIVVEAPPYPLENPPRRGNRIITCSGTAIVTHTQKAGKADIIFADYGSGYAQPHVAESLLSPPEQQQRTRRHSSKGKASGWIEERQGNKKRSKPSISYYYRWEDVTGKHSRYIPTRKLEQVQRMCELEGRTIAEILEVLL